MDKGAVVINDALTAEVRLRQRIAFATPYAAS
jgi:hypothetical protein